MTFAFTLSRVSGQWKSSSLLFTIFFSPPLRVPYGCIHQKEMIEKYVSHTQLHVTLEGPETLWNTCHSVCTQRREIQSFEYLSFKCISNKRCHILHLTHPKWNHSIYPLMVNLGSHSPTSSHCTQTVLNRPSLWVKSSGIMQNKFLP